MEHDEIVFMVGVVLLSMSIMLFVYVSLGV